MWPEMKNRKNLQRTREAENKQNIGSQWLDLVQHWWFFWELRHGMAGGYIPRISKEIFLCGNSWNNDTGDAELYSDKKVVEEKEKTGYAGALSRNMVRRKKRQLYILKIRRIWYAVREQCR